MCGIVGYYSKNENHQLGIHLEKAVQSLSKRGPDGQRVSTVSSQVGLGHTRLSIIDTSSLGNQPMTDHTGRYTITFNGEIFNFRELKQKHLSDVSFSSSSDTEVLLNLYIKLGKDCLQQLNGFFAFAIYDNSNQSIFLARDRFGIKPLHIYHDGSAIVFASELKAILSFPIKKEIDFDSLALYLQLNYFPGQNSILKNTEKLLPGFSATITKDGIISKERYYAIPYIPGTEIPRDTLPYDTAKSTLRSLIEKAVERRLVSDVPLGTFLSGGVDSSIITACASKHIAQLNTFSIGYKDEPYFDETYYANLAAKKFRTNHTVFSISNDEMLDNIFSVLDYTDEPFADSSALAVYVLSKKTRQKVTVALSGDGGDELFAGYNKHFAELKARDKNLINSIIASGLPFFKILPKSRHSKFGNLFRQIQRYSEGLNLKKSSRYWRWCSLNTQENALALLKNKSFFSKEYLIKKKEFISGAITEEGDLNDVLFADTLMVLPGDMLTKVDLMSMANSLEVRTPFLDFSVVDYVFSLPVDFKINSSTGKRILKDAFRDVLPKELFDRSKKGFEVPLLKWMRTSLRSLIEEDLLEDNFIEQQNIFDVTEVRKLKTKLFSPNAEDSHATVWGLLVFQYWFKKYFDSNAQST